MIEETAIEYVKIYEFKTQKERDDLELSMQWPEDVEKFKRLISPTNITELVF